jgi:hypothetical protein
MSAPQSPPPSIEITRAGWVALILSIAAGVGLRIALQVWDPERFVQTTRNDPRQGGLGVMFMIPVFALCVWVVCTLLGYPLIRVVHPPTTPNSDRGPDVV